MRIEDCFHPRYRHFLFKDENEDSFIIDRIGEIYLPSDADIILLSFSRTIPTSLLPYFTRFDKTDEPLWWWKGKVADLPQIMPLLKFKRRPTRKFLDWAEKRLGHKIFNYRPKQMALPIDSEYIRLSNLKNLRIKKPSAKDGSHDA